MAPHGDSLPSTPDQFPASDKFDAIVEVKVGPALDRSFFLHKGIVTFYSGYFRAAVNGNFAEAGKGIIKLPTEDAGTFGRFVDWIYHRRLDFDALEGGPVFLAMCHLWVLADTRNIPMLANAMITAIRDQIVKEWIMPTNVLPYVYENSGDSAMIRRFLIRMIANTGSQVSCMTAESRVRWPEEALWDLSSALWALKDNSITKNMSKTDIATMDVCEYHDHQDGVKCTKHAA
ncbi:hypothetical protein LTR08_008039 [Meristemomyces frigidus]|nr:hypothetical protein LTR08_008039 [Meristemomyces frigidus]